MNHPSRVTPAGVSPSSSSSHRPLITQTSLSSFGVESNLRQSTFNPEGDVIPMLGRSYSTLTRNQVKPLAVDNPQSHQLEDGFYDKVYDDNTMSTTMATHDVEEVYDDPTAVTNTEQVYDFVSNDSIGKDPSEDSFETGSDESAAANPLYDNLKVDLERFYNKQ